MVATTATLFQLRGYFNMSFPISPIDGQLTTVNGITYTWSSANTTWTRNTGTSGYLVDYIQATVTTPINNITTNTDLIFDTPRGGSGIGYNPGNGIFTLAANKTYELYAAPEFNSFSDTTNGYLTYEWVDATNNTTLVNSGAVAGIAIPINRNTNEAPTAVIKLMYTPTTNQTVKLRVTGATGSATLRGGAGSYVRIIQIGGTALTGNITIGGNAVSTSSTTGAVIVTGGLGVSGNLNVGGNLTANITANVFSANTFTASNANISVGNISTLNATNGIINMFSSTTANLTTANIANLIGTGPVKFGNGSFTKNLSNGDVSFDNGTLDTPGVLFYSNNATNFGIDSYSASGSVPNYLRITKNLNETGGAELVRIDQGGNITLSTSSSSMYYNQRKFEWSSLIHNSPTNSTPAGVLLSNAVMASSQTDGVQLTLASQNQNGSVAWNLSTFDFTKDFIMEASIYMDNASNPGADGVWLGVGGNNNYGTGATSIPGGSSTINGSLMVRYLTYSNNRTQWYINGVTAGLSNATFRTGPIYRNNWYTAKIMIRTVGNKRYAYLYGPGGVLDNALDVTSWTPGGNWIVVGGATGGSYSNQYVNHVSLEYI